MKRYNVSQHGLNIIKKLVIVVTVIFCIDILFFTSQLMEMSSYERKENGGSLYFNMAMSAGGLILCRMLAYAYANLRNHYLLVEADKISGAGSRKRSYLGETQSFSVSFEEVIQVVLERGKSSAMRIDTKYGSYYLCVEHAENAIREIDACRQAAKKKAESHAHQ